jgi:hypothetical protein
MVNYLCISFSITDKKTAFHIVTVISCSDFSSIEVVVKIFILYLIPNL